MQPYSQQTFFAQPVLQSHIDDALRDLQPGTDITIDGKDIYFVDSQVYAVNDNDQQYQFTFFLLFQQVRSHLIKNIGADNFFDSRKQSFHQIFNKLDHKVCQTCPSQIFKECP